MTKPLPDLPPPEPLSTPDRFRGCLLAGAVGDALGAPIEFMTIADVRKRFGPAGITGFVDDAVVTDDTQMTLFTAEGLIRAMVRTGERGICHPPTVVQHAYLRWLHTQGVPWDEARHGFGSTEPDGWLVQDRRLHVRRAPGNTCLSALRAGGHGTPEQPINDSKGCGGVMRAAPVGLVLDAEPAFELGCQIAALTHGHPSGYLPAGVLAATVSQLVNGKSLREALHRATSLLAEWPGHDQTYAALEAAFTMAGHGRTSPEDLERLGGGWVGEEALAIAACCALAKRDGRDALLASVNHSGDSDTTGSICGNLVGAMHGQSVVPAEWIDALDVADLVGAVADDLWRQRFQPPADELDSPPAAWWDRYPGH